MLSFHLFLNGFDAFTLKHGHNNSSWVLNKKVRSGKKKAATPRLAVFSKSFDHVFTI
jgi:hypothetical protein